jgi:predicted aspartyl protease
VKEDALILRFETLKRIFAALFILFCAGLIIGTPVRSEFYKYVDKDGKIFYVDDLSKVPPEYQDQIKVYEEKYDHLPEDQRSTARDQDRAAEAEIELEHRQRLERELYEAEAREREEQQRQAVEKFNQKLTTKVLIEGNRVFVPVTLNNNGIEVETLLLLDTGASATVIHRSIADQLNIVTLRKGQSQVAGGSTIQTDVGKISFLKVGPIKLIDPHVLIISHKGPGAKNKGLLGMNFLRSVQYQIDFEKQEIKWIPPSQQGNQ